MIQRRRFVGSILQSIEETEVTTLLGARQVGKTTLAQVMHEQAVAQGREVHYFDLEIPADRQALEQGYEMLKSLSGLVIIDEIQRMPELFAMLRPLADRADVKTRFIILGSASPQIVDGISESLAGRSRTVDITGLRLDELAPEDVTQLWLRGGFPRSYLAASDAASLRWRQDFMRTFLERDIPQLGYRIPAEALRRFWTMMAHNHCELYTATKIATGMDLTYHTVNSYRDILAGTYMLRVLQPWHENIGKRLVKQPKVMLRDSGFLHALLHIADERSLRSHPIVGASWEGFVVEQILAVCGDYESYFYRTHAGTELDLLLIRGVKRYGFEIKLSDQVKVTKSMRHSLVDLHLDHLYIVYNGSRAFQVDEKVSALPVRDLAALQLV